MLPAVTTSSVLRQYILPVLFVRDWSRRGARTVALRLRLYIQEKPEDKLLRFFGIKAFFHKSEKERHGRIDSRAVERILVGYYKGDAYRVCLPQ